MKKIFLICLMSLIIILMTKMIYGAVTCAFDQTATTAGTSSTYIRETAVNLSATLTVGDPGINATSATISAGASGCTISGALNFNRTGLTNGTYFNTTVNTEAMKDDTTCTFTMTVKNITNQNTLATCTRDFISDNSVPTLTLVSPTDDSTDTDGSVAFEMTCVNTSSATLSREGYYSYTMTESSDSCTLTIADLTNSKQSWYITASDGLNSTTGSTYTVNIVRSGGVLIDTQGQIIQPTTTVTQKKGIKGFIEFLISIPLKILGSIFSIFK